MAIYEFHCPRCEVIFEALVQLSKAREKHSCPGCGCSSRRVVSSFAIGPGGRGHDPTALSLPRGARSDVTQMRVPNVLRPCWMDDYSAARMAAYKHGRGAEFDDVAAAKNELRMQRGGLPPAPKHGHAHDHVAKAAARAKARAAKIIREPTGNTKVASPAQGRS